MKKLLPSLAAIALLAPLSASAQFETASVLGYVRDAAGASVTGASVSLINEETKATVTVRTNGQGAYEFTDVKIGQYEVRAERPGFDRSVTAPFTVQVNARQRVDLNLRAGSANETVTVNAAAELLETDSSERGQVIGTREVENLPLNGRAYADLAALVPGVRRNILENGTNASRDASFNVNGQRSEFNNFLLDGVDNNAYGTSNQGFSNQAIPPSPDAISEFKVETDNYSAEYGRAAGAVINVSIRSGTNNFHGKAYDYLRNTIFNAIGPFTPPANALTGNPQKPVLIRNQFGGTFGGPIFRDKLFFFADYEGTRQIVHAITYATVPTANQAGTSALAKTNGGYTFVALPLDANGKPTSNTETGNTVALLNPLNNTPYANGVIPFSDPSISAFAKGVLAALPAANVPGAPLTNNYASLPADTLVDDKGDGRLDYTLSGRTTMFARYSEHQGLIGAPPAIQGPAGGNSNGQVKILNKQAAGGVTHLFSQNSILDVRFAWTHTDGGKGPYGANLPSLEAGIPGLPTDPRVVRSLNAQILGGYTQFGNQTSNPQFQNPTIYNPKVNYTLIKGRNSYKAGYEYQHIATVIDDFNPTYGQDTYNNGFSFAGAGAVSGKDASTKEAANFADFLFGTRDSFQLNNFQVVNLNQRMHFFYFQDDIRATSKLTLNLGLRYELVTPQWESNNLLSNFNPATNSLTQATGGSLFNQALVHTPKKDLAPRVGLAFAANPKTVIRAAYGINFQQFNREGGENLLVYNLPAIVNTNINQVPQFALASQQGGRAPLALCSAAQAAATYDSTNPTPCFRTSSQGYPTGLVAVPTLPTDLTARNLNTQARYIPSNLPTGYVQSYHLTLQQEIAKTTVEVSYVGEHGVKLQTLADFNQAAPNPVTATCQGTITSGCLSLAARRPIPSFTTIEETIPAGFLSYNALQVKLEHRFGGGLYILNSFTWSHAFDNASGHLDTPNGDNSRINLANGGLGERGNSAYNQPINNVLSVVYDLPYGHGRRFGAQAPFLLEEVLGGWQLTAINDNNSGQPINVVYSANGAQAVSTILAPRPNQIPGVNPVLPKNQRTRIAGNSAFIALNPAAFSIPTANQPYGNAQRNTVRFDAYRNTDIGLHKQFALYPENVKLEFRAEAFNILNQTNYALATSNLSNSGAPFGTVNAAETFPARVLQFAAKILF